MTEAGSSHSFPFSSQQLSLFLLGVFIEGSYGRRPLQLVIWKYWTLECFGVSERESWRSLWGPGAGCEFQGDTHLSKDIKTLCHVFPSILCSAPPSHLLPGLVLLNGLLCSSPSFLSGATSPRTLPPLRFYKKLLSLLRVFLNTSPIYTVPSSPPLAPQSCPVVYSSWCFMGLLFPIYLHLYPSTLLSPITEIFSHTSVLLLSQLSSENTVSSRKHFSGLRKNRKFLRKRNKANIVKQVWVIYLYLGSLC